MRPRLVCRELELSQVSDRSLDRRRLSVVIPCRDEQMNVTSMISALLEWHGDQVLEIIIVDDHSRDETPLRVAEAAQLEPRVRLLSLDGDGGVGRALAAGIRAAQGPYVLTMDCDFESIVPEVGRLLEAIDEGHDVAIGSRFREQLQMIDYPRMKAFANRMFHRLARLALGRRFHDVTNNFKLMRREVAQRLVLTESGFAVNAEAGLQPFFLGASVAEVPVSWIGRSEDMGVSSFRILRTGPGFVRVLAQLTWYRWFRRGRYRDLQPLEVPPPGLEATESG